APTSFKIGVDSTGKLNNRPENPAHRRKKNQRPDIGLKTRGKPRLRQNPVPKPFSRGLCIPNACVQAFDATSRAIGLFALCRVVVYLWPPPRAAARLRPTEDQIVNAEARARGGSAQDFRFVKIINRPGPSTSDCKITAGFLSEQLFKKTST